jgi:trehalose 6-phosphate synthase
VIVSNRGPYTFKQESDQTFSFQRGSGGLVTALAALAQDLDVLWIASAPGEADKAWASQQGDAVTEIGGIKMRLVISEEAPYHAFYNVISNPLLWFIQHGLWDMVRTPMIDRNTWEAWEHGYQVINKQIADVVIDAVQQLTADTPERPVIIMPQDYHLYLLPQYLREAFGDRVQIQPFIHIPVPGPDGWRALPQKMRDQLITSLLASDRIGFQTRRDAFNFIQTARFYVEDAHTHGARDAIEYRGRKMQARDYPISIDIQKVQTLVEEPQTRMHKDHLISQIGDRKLILRVDRVEPSKNILRGLQAYRTLLDEYPEHHNKVQMLMLLVPSRMEVDEYQTYLRDIMAEAGIINASFSDELWQPVITILGNNYARALAAMEIYDVLLVNPIADGMNLVAKEGPLVNTRDGVLLLSEHAGAFYELGEHALTVSPFDIYSTALAMHEALSMSRAERETRAIALRDRVTQSDVNQWFNNQVQDALAAFNTQSSSNSTSATP